MKINRKDYPSLAMVVVALALTIILILSSGCAGSTGNIVASDPVERGCSYIAAAIVTNGILRALFNK